MIHPLQPLAPIQRLGWLQYFNRIKCAKAFATFKAGTFYEISTEIVTFKHYETRRRHDGFNEPVTLTGSDLLVRINDGRRASHRFIAVPQSAHPVIHDHLFLVEHFHIPEILDLGCLRSGELSELRKRLRALERSKPAAH